MTKPLISINIPVYKCENYITRCLDSVKNQTYKNLEVLLVNDCTPDKSVGIVEKYIKENPDLTIKLIHHKTNQGLSVVRNTGIDNSIGEYIFFLDSDDEITADCIEKLVQTAAETKAQVIIGQNRWINTFDNSIKDFGFPTRIQEKYLSGNSFIFEKYVEDVFPTMSWNKLFERNFLLINKIYFIPGLFAQDELWFFHLMLKSESIGINFNITYLYYLHKDSVIFNRKKRNFDNYITILEYFSKAYDDADLKVKKLIKKKIIHFKEMVLVMQWKAMRGEADYLRENYSKMKSMPKLSLSDYLNNDFDSKTKKLSFYQNLPTSMGVKWFVKRFG